MFSLPTKIQVSKEQLIILWQIESWPLSPHARALPTEFHSQIVGKRNPKLQWRTLFANRWIFYILSPFLCLLVTSSSYHRFTRQMHPLSCVCRNRKTQIKQNKKNRAGVIALILLTETTTATPKCPPNCIIIIGNYSEIASPRDWRWNLVGVCGVTSCTHIFPEVMTDGKQMRDKVTCSIPWGEM